MRSTYESQISRSIQFPALFSDEQQEQQEGILRRVRIRTGLDLRHRNVGELSRSLEVYDDDSVAKLCAIVADCSNDEQLHRLGIWEHRLSISAIVTRMATSEDQNRA